MNIKDIARLTGVSVSTVSKIINDKADNIREETRERVLAVVREHNYVPYAGVRKSSEPSMLLGLLLCRERGRFPFSQGFAERAAASGYGTLTLYASDAEEQLSALRAVSAHRVDGFVWDRPEDTPSSDEFPEGLPIFCPLDCASTPTQENGVLDYEALGVAAAGLLWERRHVHLCCLVPREDSRARRFLAGCRKCMLSAGLPYTSVEYAVAEDPEAISRQLGRATGFVCFDVALASSVYEAAYVKRLKIPRDLSVVSLAAESAGVFLRPALTMVELPMRELGARAAGELLFRICGEPRDKTFRCEPRVCSGSSVDVPITARGRKIVVVGAMNTDTLIRLPELPEVGETVSAGQLITMPGGKGANQAIGAALLGAEVYLVGHIGRDYEGGQLCSILREHRVNIDGVTTGGEAVTGRAYVYVCGDGTSSIVVYPGANAYLTPAQVEKNATAFEHAAFCLLQTEVSMDVVECAAHMARKNNVQVILKPCAVNELPDSLLKSVDFLIPNRMELNRICRGSGDVEEKAESLLQKGVGRVIVTLGPDGCYLRDREQSRYFPAADFPAVDTTGAADAFAAALAVYLSRDGSLNDAIRYAVYAAGYSITREGATGALADKTAMELFHPEPDQ